ncbi:Fiber Fb32-like protein isoform 3 [Cucumis melo var. makuwa]|uniref:Fiber Fb32-like protein isoform 3 n=1 Tax=Cucumis melo var. makuwa TaxID=1194695 RepID=A0A5D3DW70_CUCMM|nr:Fiber Fb32-like protein isoform 3 [Cucumis melo var. makuwa]
MKYEAKALAQRGHVPVNAYFRSPPHNEGKAASNVVNISSVGHGTSSTDQIDNRSQASCQVPFVNEEVAQVPNRSALELNVDLPLKKNDGVVLDKGLHESMKENTVSELLSKTNDGSFTDKLTLMESNASDPLNHSLSNVNTDINDIKKRASSVCDGFDMQLEDNVLSVGSGDGVLTNKDESKSFKKNTFSELLSEKNDGSLTDKLSLMEPDASDPLSHSLSNVSTGINDVNRRASMVCDSFDLQLEDDVLLTGNNAGVLTDKDESKSSEENMYELLSEKNDDSLRDKLTLMESTASDPLSHSLSILSTEINDSNKKASLVCDDFDMQLEDDVLLVGNNGGVLTDKDESKSSEEDSTMKLNASDPLKHMANCTSCEVKVTNDEAILILDNSHLPMESSSLSWKNDSNLSNESSDEFLKKSVTMESNTADHLNENHPNHVWSGTNFVGKEADDSNFLLKSVVLSGEMDHVVMDKDFDRSSLKGAIFEDDPRSHLLNLPRHANGISFTNEEDIMVSDRNHLQLGTEILARKNDDALTIKHSNESLKNDTILELEHDANYPLKNQPRCTSSSTKYKKEEVSSVSNDSFLKLKSGVMLGKNGKALIDKASDVSCKEQANLELSTELALHCGEESIKETLCSYGNEFEGDLVTLNGGLQETLIHCVDVESIHKEQTSNFSVNNLLGFSQTMETTSKYLENGISCSSNAVDATSSELASIVLTSGEIVEENNLLGFSQTMETTFKYLENGIGCSSNAVDATSSEQASIVLTSGETVEETQPVSSLKPLAKGSFSAFGRSFSNLSSGTVVHEKPVEHNAHTECRSRSSFEVFNSPSYGNNASNMKLVSSKSSLSSMESLEPIKPKPIFGLRLVNPKRHHLEGHVEMLRILYWKYQGTHTYKIDELLLSLPIAETHASRANDTTFLPKFYTRRQGDISKSTSSGNPSFSTVGCPHDSSDYILDAEMETVDLGHKVTHENECDVLDYKALHAVSRRTQKLRSYKKRIQDAFTSKKRLAKEYEQLAIWYGDTDMEFSTNSSQKLEKENTSTNYLSDSEWELL